MGSNGQVSLLDLSLYIEHNRYNYCNINLMMMMTTTTTMMMMMMMMMKTVTAIMPMMMMMMMMMMMRQIQIYSVCILTDVGRCSRRSGEQKWLEETHCSVCCPAREVLRSKDTYILTYI